MKRRLLLVIALAVFGTAVAASAVGAAQGGLIGTGQSGVEIDLPDAETLPACSNLADDDGDGKADLDDPGCSDPLDGDESNPPPGGGGGQVDPEGDGNGGAGGGGGGKGPGGKSGGGKNTGGGNGGVSAPTAGGGGDSSAAGDDGDGGTKPPPPRLPDGTPTRSNPTTTIADFGPTPIGVPNFMIDQFSIPPFLLPIYQACGTEYGIPWQVLASINRIETAFGTNLNVSSAGAMGWMQFIPSSWKAYGVDANNDGRKDPYNPVDAICAAARYLRAAGGQEDLPRAIFAYNHADWYVDEVLLYARQYGKLPDDLVGSLTGLTEGAHFPIAARARYADDISERQAARRAEPTDGTSGNVADVVTSSATRRGINIYSREGAPVVAVNDGVIRKIGEDPKLGRYIVLQDAYGNRFTYAELGKVSKVHPVPKRRDLSAADFKLISPKRDKTPTKPASADGGDKGEVAGRDDSEGLANTEDARERLYALPQRPRNVDRASVTGQLDNLLGGGVPGYETVKAYFSSVLEFDRRKMELRPLREGSKVSAGTVLARVGEPGELASHINFSIRPTGRGAPKIDPKPILDGWKLLEATAIYRAAGKNPFTFNHGASVGQILLMSKSQLERRVLADPRLEIYSCGREDIRTHQIDRRVLATLEYLAESGFRLTVTSLKCGHSFYTSAGSISHHSSGNAVDIAQVNGLPILGNQGRGSITESVLQQLLRLQGTMRPAQVISLMQMGGPTFAMSDHADHIHVGFTPAYDPRKQGKQFVRLLEPDQWERLIGRIAEIDNPDVPTKPSKSSLPAPKARKGERASHAHTGE